MLADDDPQESPLSWLIVALALLIAFAPLPLGSNRPWAVALLAFGSGGLLLVSWVVLLWRGQSPLACLAPARIPLAALAAYAVLVAAQWEGGAEGSWLYSAAPHQTRHYLLRTLVYASVFANVLLIVRSPRDIRLLSIVLVASGGLQALLAIYWLAVGAQYQFMFEDIRHGTQATGTFVNRNHLAGYLCLTLAAGIGLLLGAIDTSAQEPRRWRDHLINLLRFALSPRMALRLLLLVMVIALVLTRSRMGNTAFFSALVVLGTVVAITAPALRGKALVLVASMVVIDVVVVGQWVGLDRVLQRIDRTAIAIEDRRGEETVESRLDPAWYTWPMVQARPVLGWGGGSYFVAFPPFKSPDMVLHQDFFDHAHNDYAEIAADTGLVGLLLLATVVLATLRRAWQLLTVRGQPLATKGAAYAGVMAITCLLLHSLVDFNLQIPANALTCCVLLALVWATRLQRSAAAGVRARPALPAGPGAGASPRPSLASLAGLPDDATAPSAASSQESAGPPQLVSTPAAGGTGTARPAEGS
ncbi:O-antigen ligase family protein [Piscinibacter sakaiensis]|uniref:RbmD protein n=1 Tax=Piscinibacter sakaiensis TaxID=1547922 RepID=A0A0K8NU65_PISS1|nr:O-antigen ligase family protein [Piscinibacter sakaiensis]GAP33951.1 RbmD protein [Piscinibacter sakaiensis]